MYLIWHILFYDMYTQTHMYTHTHTHICIHTYLATKEVLNMASNIGWHRYTHAHITHTDDWQVPCGQTAANWGQRCGWWWRVDIFAHKWIDHVSHINESKHTHKWVMRHRGQLRGGWWRVNESWHIHEWVMSPTSIESCRVVGWVMAPIGMSSFWWGATTWRMITSCSVTLMDESCRTHEWVMSHTWMSHVAPMNESCRSHEWVMSHTWMSHVAPNSKTCLSWGNDVGDQMGWLRSVGSIKS